jgi:hypothetical protein
VGESRAETERREKGTVDNHLGVLPSEGQGRTKGAGESRDNHGKNREDHGQLNEDMIEARTNHVNSCPLTDTIEIWSHDSSVNKSSEDSCLNT